ncbi:hypothetical protein J2T18_003674 [Paenibacillus polymyxa]|nr:hypothetical protein [Paenibacillus polymyxa]
MDVFAFCRLAMMLRITVQKLLYMMKSLVYIYVGYQAVVIAFF